MSIELKRMTPSRAAYFMERFKREEKLLGPNEQAALTYVIDMLEKATAIQQAEAQQPTTGEPVVSRNPFASRCYTMSESHLSGHRLIVGFEKLGDVQDAHEWVARQARGDFTHTATTEPVGFTYQAEIDYANSTGGNGSFWRVPPDLDDEAVPLYDHPAPSVLDDVVRDAERYRWLRDEHIGNCPESINLSHGRKPGLDEAIDAAMLAAKERP